jgi:long-chain acyl-CoA synthetase
MIVDLEDLTIPGLLARSSTLYKNLPAVAFVGETPITYGDLLRHTEDLAQRLLDRNVARGQRVAILGESSPQWVIAYLAIARIGAVAVPILPGFPDQDVRHIIRDSGCVAVFVTSKQSPKLADAEMPDVHTVLALEDLTARTSTAGNLDTRTWPVPDDVAVIIYTSGTTGHSKGVMLTHRNIVWDVVGSVERFPISSDDRFLSVLPLSHAYEVTGGLLCELAVGASIFYLRGLPAPKTLISAAQTVKPTAILMVPLIMDKIYRKRILGMIRARRLNWLYRVPVFRKLINRMAGKKLIRSLGGHIRFFMLGGAPLNKDLEVFLEDAAIGYSTGYGMTEAAPILTINPLGKVRKGSCGKPIPGVEMRIDNPDPESGVGEIVVRGPNIMKGYYKNDDATRDVLLEGQWLRTGDLGCFDPDGYLHIKGRSKNVIVDACGENIYPEIIEQHLLKSPYILQAIVYKHEGRLVARAYLDKDVLDRELRGHDLSEPQRRALIRDRLEEIRGETNRGLPAFSAIQEILEQPEPFALTPTNNVKRYLSVS